MASKYEKRGGNDHRQKRILKKSNHGRLNTPKPDYSKPADPYPDYGMPVIPRPDYTVKIKHPANRVPVTKIEDLYAVPNKKKNNNRSKQQPKLSISSTGSHEPEFLNKLEKSLVTHDEKLSAKMQGKPLFTKNDPKSPNQQQSSSGSNSRGKDYRHHHEAPRQYHDYDDQYYDMRYRHPDDEFYRNSLESGYRNSLENGYVAENFARNQYEEDIRYQDFPPEDLGIQNLSINDYDHPKYDDGYDYQGYQNGYHDHEYYIDEYGRPYYPADEYNRTNNVRKNVR